MSWTSADLWSSWSGSKEKAETWYYRAEAHLNRKKVCEDCEREMSSQGCSIWFNAWERAEKHKGEAEGARNHARRLEKQEGIPLTIDGVKTQKQYDRELVEERARKDAEKDQLLEVVRRVR